MVDADFAVLDVALEIDEDSAAVKGTVCDGADAVDAANGADVATIAGGVASLAFTNAGQIEGRLCCESILFTSDVIVFWGKSMCFSRILTIS